MTTTRGGGGDDAAVSKKSREEDNNKKAQAALDSMKFTYRWCFASVLADVFITVIDNSVWKQRFTWLVAVDILDSLNLVLFGYGLWRVTKLYGKNLVSSEKMSLDDVLDLCRTMARIWRSTAWSIVAVAMSLSASLVPSSSSSSSSGLGLAVVKTASPPLTVFVLAALGSVLLRRRCARDAAAAVNSEKESRKTPLEPDAKRAREAGFHACRNMSLCMGSFAVMGVVQVVHWVVTPASVGGRVFSVFDFITPFAISGLLSALYRSFLRAVMTVTGERNSGGEEMEFGLYDDLYEAQLGFYSKVGDTLKSATIFSLLPYAFAPIQPYVMSAAAKVFPSMSGEL